MFPSGRFQTVFSQDSPFCGGGFVEIYVLWSWRYRHFVWRKNHTSRQKYRHPLENSYVPWPNFQLNLKSGMVINSIQIIFIHIHHLDGFPQRCSTFSTFSTFSTIYLWTVWTSQNFYPPRAGNCCRCHPFDLPKSLCRVAPSFLHYFHHPWHRSEHTFALYPS